MAFKLAEQCLPAQHPIEVTSGVVKGRALARR